MDWWQAAGAILSAAAILMLTGVPACAAAGARGITLWASSGPAAVSIASVSAVVLGSTGYALTPLAVAVAAAAAAVLILLVRLIIRRLRPIPPSGLFQWTFDWQSALRLGIVCASIGLLLFRLMSVFGRMENISQTLDNIFHLNLARYILDTGNGSALTAGRFTDPAADFAFYPAAWHDAVALTAAMSGAELPAAATAVNLVIGAVLWPLGVILIGTMLAGNRPVVWAVSGLLAGAFPAFPYLMVDFGVLYPNYLSIALLPTLLALFAGGMRKGSQHIHVSTFWLLFAVGLPGLALAHPSALLALIAFTLPLVVSIPWSGTRDRSSSALIATPQFWLLWAAVAAYLAGVAYVWQHLRPDIDGVNWGPLMNPAQALGKGFLNAPFDLPVPVLIAVLTAVGTGRILFARRNAWAVGVFGVGVALFTIAAGLPWSDFRTAVVGNWYNDPPRLAALLPLAAIGVVVVGGTFVTDWCTVRLGALAGKGRGRQLTQEQETIFLAKPAGVLTGLVLAAAMGWAGQQASVQPAVADASLNYELSDTSKLLSADEEELLSRVDQVVPPDATVVGNPATGASLVYALADRKTLTPHVFWASDPKVSLVLDHLDEAAPGSDVCAAVEELNAFYALDFGTLGVHGEVPRFPGMDNLEANPGFELVEQVGDARLYRVIACGQG